MGKVVDTIDPDLKEWIETQPMFFVGTAPLDTAGHVNCSPKGGDTFRVLGEREVGYLDYTGSGAETMAHLRENGRIVIMFCEFSGASRILRLYGRGEAIPLEDPRARAFAKEFPVHRAARSVVVVQVERVANSCGYGVPVMDFVAQRPVFDKWADAKSDDEIRQYRRDNNVTSIDGLPAFDDEA